MVPYEHRLQALGLVSLRSYLTENLVLAYWLSEGVIITPKRKAKGVDLRQLGLYAHLLAFAQKHWVHLQIVDDFSIRPAGATIFGGSQVAKSVDFVFKDGTWYRCSTAVSARAGISTGDHFACVNIHDGRYPCKILYHFKVTVPGALSVYCSVVQHMVSDDSMPLLPLDL